MHTTLLNGIGRQCLLVLFCACAVCDLSAQSSFCFPNQPGFSDCEQINCKFCTLNGYVGSTAGYGGDPDGDLSGFFCSSVQNVQYLDFVASVTTLSITVTLSNCTVNSGIDLGLMPSCDVPLVACVQGNGTNTTTIIANNLIVGSRYVLIIDVDAQSACDFTITTFPATGTSPPDMLIPTNLSLSGDFSVCPNATTNYQLVPGNFQADVVWTAPSGVQINGQPAPQTTTGAGSTSATFTWGTMGGLVCATPSNFCFTGTPICHNVTVTPIPPTILAPVTICAEEAPYELPWSVQAYSSGTYSTVVSSFQGCDSTLKKTVTVRPAIVRNLPPIGLCKGDCITVCDEQFCGPGSFTGHCKSVVTGCDSTVNITIVDATPIADITGGGALTCAHLIDTLGSKFSPGTKTWYNNAGQQIGTGNNLVVQAPGIYILSVTRSQNGAVCTLTDTIVVPIDTLRPGVSATGGAIGCDTVPVFVHASSNVPAATYIWAGPNGFTSTQQNPQIPGPGTYLVTAVNPANGCSGKDTAIVALCCLNSAGTMDTASLSVCGQKPLYAIHLGDQNLPPGDSLIFILYTNPADPLGSVVEYSDMPVFPFAPGLLQIQVKYYVMAVSGHVTALHTIDFSDPCLSLAPGPVVQWLPKPVISVVSAPNALCKGDCMDITFNFTGTPPFQFSYQISQNGQVVYSGNETSNALQKTITICTSAFNPPAVGGNVDFKVSFYQDKLCTCAD
jgi:hypothetical protein